MQTAKEQLEIYLGGNMNTCSLTPSAIVDLMQGYAKHALYCASEEATLIYESDNTGNIGHYGSTYETERGQVRIDKDSILALKEKV